MAYLKNFKNKKNSDTRNYEAVAMVGEKRVGKSSLVKIYIDKYLKKYDVRVLVFDISDAFGEQYRDGVKIFDGYPIITQEQLLNPALTQEELIKGVFVRNGKKIEWQRGVKRITEIDNDVFLKYASEIFRNGLLVIDEATTLFNPNPSVEQIKFLITHTNHRCDGLFIFHRLADIPKRLRNNFWKFILFATGDNVDRTDPQKGVKDIKELGFQNAENFYQKWIDAQVPEDGDKIIQHFNVHKKNDI